MNELIIKAKPLICFDGKPIEGAIVHITDKGRFRLMKAEDSDVIVLTIKVEKGEFIKYDANQNKIKEEKPEQKKQISTKKKGASKLPDSSDVATPGNVQDD